MKSSSWLGLLAALALVLWAGSAMAAGFGTPVVDGVLDAVYGSPEASDPDDDPQGNTPMDLLDLYVINDNTYWYFLFTIDENIGNVNWGKYILYIDTTGNGNGAPTDAWGRNVVVVDPHKPEFSINTWVDVSPYGTGNVQFWSWNGSSWSSSGSIADAALGAGAVSAIEYKVSRAALGDPSTIWCEVYSTGGGSGDNAQDTCNDPADEWNATNWSSQAILLNSTRVDRASGGDTTPPTVSNVVSLGSDPISQIQVVFSEPVDEATAENTTNYDINGGISVTQAERQADEAIVVLDVSPALSYGTCYTVTVTGVKDLAGNTIVNDGVGNVGSFKLFNLTWQANMNLYLRDNGAAPLPDTVAVEGSLSPLTWDPTCDNLLFDADMDSVFTGSYQFCIPCDPGTGLIEETTLQYKFTHQCTTWESVDNHVYTFSDDFPTDTLDIWWNNEAPVDFTDKAIDVIWTVSMENLEFPPTSADTVGINGSDLPLTWDVPPVNELADDGVAPDETAGDGIWSIKLTFPAGTYKYPEYKFLINSVYECEGQANREIFLNDELYSQANPLVMPLLYYDLCLDPTDVEETAPASLLGVRIQPNPASGAALIRFQAPENARGEVAVFDAGGRMVREVAAREFQAGPAQVSFDGRDGSGRTLSPGIYFVRVNVNGAVETRTLSVVR